MAMGRIATAFGAGLLGLCLTVGVPQAAEIFVTVQNVRNGDGSIRLVLFDDPERFPMGGWTMEVAVPARTGETIAVFEGIEPDTYAMIAYHDEDDDSNLDTFLRIPREGFGFSNDAKVKLGPPTFGEASFVVEIEGARLTISINY